MHRKLCVHAQFSVLMVCLRILNRINSPLRQNSKAGAKNEFDIAFEDNYKSIELKLTELNNTEEKMAFRPRKR